ADLSAPDGCPPGPSAGTPRCPLPELAATLPAPLPCLLRPRAEPGLDLVEDLLVADDVFLGGLDVDLRYQILCVRWPAPADAEVSGLVDPDLLQRDVVLGELHEVLADEERLVGPAQPLGEPARVLGAALLQRVAQLQHR